MQNADVARIFETLADLLEIQEANPFRVRAYRNASRTVEGLTESLSTIIEDPDRTLDDLPGIGKDLAGKIKTILDTNTLPQLEELKSKIPPGVVQMLNLPGIGPKKVAVMFRELKVNTLEDLRAAGENGRISALKGFGKKTEQTILENIDSVAAAEQRFHLNEAITAGEAVVASLRELKSVTQADLAGSSRRRKETAGDLDVLAIAADSQEPMDHLAEHELVAQVLQRGPTKMRVRLHLGIELDLRVVPEESYGAALVYFTGSKEHNIVLRKRAQERKLKLNEYGLFPDDQDKSKPANTEEAVYKLLDLPWIPPELREDRGEFDAAENGKLPELVEVDDIRGDLHMHTTASDGKNSILEMAEAAKKLGRKYIAITDHSKRVSMANGLDAKRLRKHWQDIDKANDEISGIEIWKGIECDILEDATMDLADDVLAEADWVIAVLHYGLKQPKDQINKRLLAAIQNPYVHCIGHPTGRLLLRRPGADMDFHDILKAAADHGVLMEINASPERLDLSDVHAQAAADMGIPIVINTDAHNTSGFATMKYGVYQARRAGLEKKQIANTRTPKQFRKLLRTS